MKSIWAVLTAIALTCILPAQSPPTDNRSDVGIQNPAQFGRDPESATRRVGPPALPLAQVRIPDWARLRTAVTQILGWNVGVPAGAFSRTTFADVVADANALDVAAIEGNSAITVSVQIQKKLDYNLMAGEVAAVQDVLKTYSIRMPAYLVPTIGPDEESTQKLFEFAKHLGVTVLISDQVPKDMSMVEQFANKYGINVALSGNPNDLTSAIQGRSKRIGVYVDIGKWMDQGQNLPSRIELFNDRIFAVRLNGPRRNGGPVEPGSGADIAKVLNELYQLNLKPLFLAVEGSGGQNVTSDLSRSLSMLDDSLRPIAADRIRRLSQEVPTRGPEYLTAEERDKILAAVPQIADATPKKQRKLLILDLNVAYGGTNGGHHSIPAANLAVGQFGRKTGAFEAIFSNDLDNLKYPKIKQFDAILLNNTVGPLFEDPEVREGLIRFVKEGGGLAAYHGASHTSLDWPEFGEMLGTRQGSGRGSDERAIIKIDDLASPLTAVFEGKEFVHNDEYYRYATGPYSRATLHVLLSIDVAKTDMNQGPNCMRVCWRADNDYAVAWIRSYGKGRVFFTGLGHTADFFMDKSLERFFFDGVQFALGDLDADTTPSLNATRATESSSAPTL